MASQIEAFGNYCHIPQTSWAPGEQAELPAKGTGWMARWSERGKAAENHCRFFRSVKKSSYLLLFYSCLCLADILGSLVPIKAFSPSP